MRFIVPVRRAGVDDLIKSRGPSGGHKYIKRQRAFVGGKLVWNYYYADDASRTAGKAHHDPKSKHKHHLAHEHQAHHPNLATKALGAVDATLSVIKNMFGWGKSADPPRVKTTATSKWDTEVHEKDIEWEAKGGESRSTQVRIQQALELIPDHLKEMVDRGARKGNKGISGEYKGLKDFRLMMEEEDPVAIKYPGVVGHANPGGDLVINSGAITMDIGEPKYGKAKTYTEMAVNHEFGHHVHFAIQVDAPAVWKQWVSLSDSGVNKITPYAHKDVYEDWAESFSCATLHPKQLAEECPEKYEFLRKHVLPDLKTIPDIMATHADDLAWWSRTKETPATKVSRALEKEEPAQQYHPYPSEQDQFYQVAKDGRHVYIRFGPSSKLDEDGWDRMPATLDPQTGLPRYEGGMANKLRSQGAIKEVYTESGRPLSLKQAYLYLGQDDPAVEKLVHKAFGAEDPVAGVAEFYKKRRALIEKNREEKRAAEEAGRTPPKPKKLPEFPLKDIGRKMFDSLGGNLDDDLAKERKRVAKMVAAGKDPSLGRHEWVPVEVTPDEFLAKSGTFKFSNVRAAKEQTNILYETQGGKRVAATRYDPVTKKHVPQLAATLYEQRNPDGTYTRIHVQESSSFATGETIMAPQVVRVKRDDGTVDKRTKWKPYTLKKGDSSDSDELGKKFGTSGARLLQANNRFGKGQIMDPLMASLLNPGGAAVISSAAELQALMRTAAAKVPRSRAWVSLLGRRGEVGTQATAHIQVEWDGAGPPKVVGDYWARKLGKDEVRIDELLDKASDIDLPRIVERKPKKEPVETGSRVWVKDPKKGRVLATYLKSARAGGKTIYHVQPIPGQGASKKMIVVEKVDRASESDITGFKDKVRRFVQPLEHDVLLWADEVPRDGGPADPGGIIRVSRPTDGSYSLGELMRTPGIRYREDAEGKVQLTTSIKDILKIRKHLGGFVMEGRVRAALELEAEVSRQRQELTDAESIVDAEDLEDAVGNINPDGLLKGLVTGDEGIQPGPHRIKALKKLADNGGRQLFAHFMGTGKTALAIMASQMMRNLKAKDGSPHPNQTSKKTLILVPLNTGENWWQEFKKFGGEPPTLIGSSSLAGAQQLPKLPERKKGELDDLYRERVLEAWAEQRESNPGLWDPTTDTNDNVVAPFEYFRENEEALRVTGLFDGMIIDEAHKVARENEVSRAIERWNPHMKMFIAMTGTPITNNLDTIPRLVKLLTDGQIDLGTPQEFTDEWLVASAAMKAQGVAKAPKTDVNPAKAGELAAILQPLMDIATTADVKGKTMPAVNLDENQPAHMVGQQARMYRAAMALLSEQDRVALEMSATLGLDETSVLSNKAKRRVNVARNISSNPAYKAPSEREDLTYMAKVVTFDKRGKPIKIRDKEMTFRLPSHKEMTGKRAGQWGGRWPTADDVAEGVVEPGYFQALVQYMDSLMGVSYESIMGKPIDKKMLAEVKKGTYVTPTGQQWAGKVLNPDYGPEGVICRGTIDEATGEINPLKYTHYDEHGAEHEREIPVGKRWVRDPNAKAQGLFYADEDWDYTGKFKDEAEGETGGGAEETDSEAEKGDDGKARKKNIQGPKPGMEKKSVQKSPARRDQRSEYDAVVTTNNAKCDKLEEWMANVTNGVTGDPNAESAQFIMFSNKIGAGARVVEAKLRTMGYQDVNEALGNADVSSEADKKRRPKKYFVTYFGKGATNGDRNLNSEIFRHKQDSFGKDTGVSMFVHRSLYGATGKPPKLGEAKEGWGRTERKNIEANFQGQGTAKSGKPLGLEVPMRVVGVEGPGGTVVPNYVYESDLTPAEKREVKDLEIRVRGAVGEAKDKAEEAITSIVTRHLTDRVPLTEHQQYVMNNTQVMCASDAANVGLNWPSAYLGMYDSLFSPMDEWQRITRAARMLPPAFQEKELKGKALDAAGKAAKVKREKGESDEDYRKRVPDTKLLPIIDKIDALIDARIVEKGIDEATDQGSHKTAMGIVQDAIDTLSPVEQAVLAGSPGAAPDQFVEALYAKRAMDKLASRRKDVSDNLRASGHWKDKERATYLRGQVAANPKAPEAEAWSSELNGLYVPPEAVQESDITNELIREHLTPFETQMLKARRYLVDVKRMTTSVEVPMMRQVTYTDPLTGERVKTSVPAKDADGNPLTMVESPSQAERAMLMQQRGKASAYEHWMRITQYGKAVHNNYEFVGATGQSLAATTVLDPVAAAKSPPPALDHESIAYAADLAKSMPVFVIQQPKRQRFTARRV